MTWIATRTLLDESGKTVRVSLGPPETVGDLWRCSVLIEAEGEGTRAGYAHGVDAFQAIQNGLERIYVDTEALGRPLTWHAPGDSGFARSMPLGLGVAFRRKAEGLIAEATLAYVDELKASR